MKIKYLGELNFLSQKKINKTSQIRIFNFIFVCSTADKILGKQKTNDFNTTKKRIGENSKQGDISGVQ